MGKEEINITGSMLKDLLEEHFKKKLNISIFVNNTDTYNINECDFFLEEI